MATRTLRLFYEIQARDQTQRGVNSAARGAKKIKSEWEQLRDSTRKGLEVGDRLASFGGRLQSFGRNTRQATLDLAGAAAESSKARAEVASLGALTRQEIDDLVRAQTEAFGQGETATIDQAKALYAAVSAGATNAAEANDLLTASNKLAIGGLADTEATVNALSKATANFGTQGVDSARAADVFFGTVRDGQVTIDELASAFPRVAATAGLVGLEFEETNAAIAVLSKTQGSAKEGASALKAALSNLLKPTKAAKDEAKRARLVYKDFEFSQAALEAKGLTGFIEDLNEANRRLQARGKKGLKLADLFGSVEAVNAIASLTDQVDTLRTTTENAVNSAGAADRAFKTIADEDAFRAAQAQAKFRQVREDVGKALIPVFADLAEQVTPLARTLAKWARDNPELVATIGKAVIVAGALATALAPVVLAISGLTTAFTLLRGATRLVDVASKSLIRTRKKEQVEVGKTATTAGKNTGALAGKLGAFAGIALEVISIIRSAQEILEASRGIEKQRERQAEGFTEVEQSVKQGAQALQGFTDQQLADLIKATEGAQIGTREQQISGSLLNSLTFGLAGQGAQTRQTVTNVDRALAIQEVARREQAGTLDVNIKIDSSERATVESLQQRGALPVGVNTDVAPAF